MVQGYGGKTEEEADKAKDISVYQIRATIVDHFVNHGLTMAEVGQRVQPNIGRSTMSSIIQTFYRENMYVYQCAVYCYTVYLL